MIGCTLLALLGVAAADVPAGTSVFLSPMGEPFRIAPNRAAGFQAWFDQADKDKNGWLSGQELSDDASRFFLVLDTVPDGEIDPDEIIQYENVTAPEIRMIGSFEGQGGSYERQRRDDSSAGRGRGDSVDEFGGRKSGASRATRAPEGLKGAGRFGLLNIPEPVSSADSNLNRGVSLIEFQGASRSRFVLLDTNHDGKLGLDELRQLLPADRR
jgi:hypothetical protein